MLVRVIGADLLITKLKLMIWILSGVMMKVSSQLLSEIYARQFAFY